MIRRLKYEEIDFDKYTSCLENSAQRTAYAQAAYLDVMCGKSWELLVLADYETVMPLPIVKKFGVRFVVRPIGIQQLGVFSAVDDFKLNQRFHRYLASNYGVVEYAYNSGNNFDGAKFLTFKNYVIEAADYETVKKNYHANRRRNIRVQSENLDKISFDKLENPESVQEFFLKFTKGMSGKDAQSRFNNFSTLAATGLVNFFVLKFDGEIASLAIMLEDDAEACAITLCQKPDFAGQNTGSILIDKLLQHYISRKRFSFMGSNIPTVAAFNSRFGAAERLYSVYQSPKIRYLNKLKSIHLMFKNNLKKVLSL